MKTHTRSLILLACLTFGSCGCSSQPGESVNANSVSEQHATRVIPSSSSPNPTIFPLRVPERVASGAITEKGGGWNSAVQRITYRTSADGTQQPAIFYKPDADEPGPLLVALHSWSSDYTQPASAIYAEWCIANGWVFIHPNFRGRNVRPEATGSELVVKDVLSAVDYSRQNARVDENRIYAVGWSGGGHLALLMAGRAPEIWAGISAWAPSSDLNAWYEESRRLGTKYVREIEVSCGGPPIGDSAAAQECRRRSPLTYLERARGVAIDINHGIRDGHGGDSTPVSQSLHAFNLLAEPGDGLSAEEIAYFTDRAEVPPHLQSGEAYTPYGNKNVLFRRQSGNLRLTVFDGGHAKDTEAALMWLNQQRKR